MPLPIGVALLALLAPPQDRLAGSSRREVEGWIQVKVQGAPRDLGFQVGSLLAAEIDDAHRAYRWKLTRSGPRDWEWFRTEARKLFWDKLDPEYREELEGQAEGLRSKGMSYDVWDVLAFNAHIELEGYYHPWLLGKASDKQSCSAFVATGSATKDGRVVIGHNLWWDYLMGQRFNVVLDLTPAKGHRIVMDTLPGFIHSGSDFAITSAGLAICETTISNFKGFDPAGLPEFMRMRKATQYAKSIEEWTGIMRKGNNGGYANTWLIADAKTGEIGKLELGLKNVIEHRSKDGYYVGANFPEDPKLIREEIEGGWDTDPRRNGCENRRLRFDQLFAANAGAVDAEKGKEFLADTFDPGRNVSRASDRTICGVGLSGGATNTKVAEAGQILRMEFWARMGVSDGRSLSARQMQPASPFMKDLPGRAWVRF